MDVANNNDGDDEEATPSKKPKATPRKRKATPAKVPADADGDDEETNGVVKSELEVEDDSNFFS